MPRPLYIVDAFADEPFSGNPAAVVLVEAEDGPAEENYMQKVAREMNLPATAFVNVPQGGANRFGLRWFTPVAELGLCGHATLASAQVLYDAGKIDLHTPIIFETRGGELRGKPDALHGGITLDFPATPPQEARAPAGLLAALGISGDSVRFVGWTRFDWFVELSDAAAVRALSPDGEALARLEGRGVVATAAGDGGFDVVSRCFFPGMGIVEDAVTGSAHCAIGPHFAPRLGKSALLCRQASARGGTVRVRVEGDRVQLGGQARIVARGELVV